MKAITREWVDKAEGDYDVVLILLRSRKPSRVSGICFHAQQCAEKYLKARLAEAHVPFPKTHDLTKLLQLVQPLEPLWLAMSTQLALLSAYAITPRYPGPNPTIPEMQEAVKSLRRFRLIAREALGA